MAKRRLKKKLKRIYEKEREKRPLFILPEETKKWLWGISMFLLAIIIIFSFFDLAGVAGKALMKGSIILIGKAIFLLPLILILGGLVFLGTRLKNKIPILIGVFILILGVCGAMGAIQLKEISELTFNLKGAFQGGILGYLLSFPLIKIFGFWVAEIIFLTFIFLGLLILWQLLSFERKKKVEVEEKEKVSLIKKIFAPKFKIKEVEEIPTPLIEEKPKKIDQAPKDFKTQPLIKPTLFPYQPPPSSLFESDRGVPTAGDIRINSAIIKRTLQNFDIQVEMGEVNIGPTVTQYTLKPAEGVKLSKITALSNDLSLALAAHPLRIEAPIPGRPLVGIEVPNKTRTLVRMRNLIENPNFLNAPSNLTFVLGRDVAGNPIYADLSRMPHLLVAGSTGTGKTVCLNTIIASFLCRNSPEILRFILIDPKRVEFTVYNDLPHLLTPVIHDAQKTVNALKWLTKEMERRFEVLSEYKARDIFGYNEMATRQNFDPMPFIVLIVDELADLMAARGREVEAGIVRLAQLARAVGIHLIVATQRPSVEVITGLIKANITSRIAFQVASQVDSRTILDMAGAEKLLGLGDMLFVSAEIVKPKRIQGVYISEREIKKVTDFIKGKSLLPKEEKPSELTQVLESEMVEGEESFDYLYGEDPLYEEAKKVVIEAKKASASFLQRRLRIGYARAARLIDMLEERGVVGPADGAKPREVYFKEQK